MSDNGYDSPWVYPNGYDSSREYEDDYDDMMWMIRTHSVVNSSKVDGAIAIDDIFDVVDWKYATGISLALTEDVTAEMFWYSRILADFAQKGKVSDPKYSSLYSYFDEWSLADVVVLPPATAIDRRLDWSCFPWKQRPTFELLYERLTLRFWEEVVSGIDPLLSQMFPFYAFPAAQKFPKVIDQWWIIILKQFMELFDGVERHLGMPPPPPAPEATSTWKQQPLSLFFNPSV
jgi:hypothetical protein